MNRYNYAKPAKQEPFPVIIMDFTGVYNYEQFARNKNFIRLDCRHLYGTECYCDKDGELALKRMIAAYPAKGIHFIDSGNYHYLTKLWTDKIEKPFSLIVFDHHPDMQSPQFGDMLSCGSWVKDVLDHNRYCKKVIIAGCSDKLIQAVSKDYGERVHFYSENMLKLKKTWKDFANEHINEPVYISIDKDVLDTTSAITNWDQGSIRLPDLKNLLGVVFRSEQIIGIDICGECASTLDLFEEEREAELDNHANKELLELAEMSGNQNKTILYHNSESSQNIQA